MKKLFGEFKVFLMQGSVLDLAVAVVIGAAFKAIVDALVSDIVNPLIGLIVGENSFDSAKATLGSCTTNAKTGAESCKGVITYGHFLGQIVNFVIIAAVIFVIIKSFERMQTLRGNAAIVEEVVEAEEAQVTLLREIRDSLASR